ncbi:hypothetical protein EDB89DRAFT_2072549 [Lactarius sanguifluus]|nr:hypothetical protein EDB89DRAFT_2072549 [Lactarius sanguifluus]
MANAVVLKVTYITDEKAMEVSDGVKAVEKNVQIVGAQVREIDENILGVGAKVKDVNGEVQVSNSLDGKAVAEEMRLDMRRTADDVDDVKRNQLQDSLKKWQSSLDPSTNHNIACGRQHGGTTGWFCQGSVFGEWKLTGSLLWTHGKPGSGNLFYGSSLLISGNIRNPMIVDQLRIIKDVMTLYDDGIASVAYSYFDFRDTSKQTRRNLLASLLIQLSACSNPFCDMLSHL